MKLVIQGHIVPYTRTTQGSKWNARYRKYTASKESIQIQAQNQIVIADSCSVPKGKPFELNCSFVLASRLYGCDLDNLAKAVADALNGVAYYDDRYCVRLYATKRLCKDGEEEGVIVEVKQL